MYLGISFSQLLGLPRIYIFIKFLEAEFQLHSGFVIDGNQEPQNSYSLSLNVFSTAKKNNHVICRVDYLVGVPVMGIVL